MVKSVSKVNSKTEKPSLKKKSSKRVGVSKGKSLQLDPLMPMGFTAGQRAKLRSYEKKIMEQ